MRFFNFLTNQPWAITESAARRMVEIYYAALERKAKGEDLDVEALEKELGRPLDKTVATTERDGVATIPIEGPIFRRADMFSDISGATTIDALARDINKALNDPKIDSIIFYVDSPGGEVNGTNELANMIFEARGKKKMVSYVAHLGASAALWMLTAADEVVVADTALVGSIGVVAAVRDPSKENKRDIEFVSSQSPGKRPDPNSSEGKAQIQSEVDDVAAVFIATVARNRNVSVEKVVKDFGAGGLLIGEKAVKAGLADRVGSYEQVLAELSGKADKPSLGNGDSRMSDTTKDVKKDGNTTLLQRLKAALSGEDLKALALDTPDESEELKTLRAKAAEADRYQKQIDDARLKEAEAFAGSLVISKVLMPAKKEQVQSIYAQLAKDDSLTPLAAGSRIESFKAMFDGLPKHNLTTELTAASLPAGSTVLNPDPDGTDPIAKDEEKIRAWGQKQNPKAA